MLVYKYASEYVIATLRDKLIRVSKATELNDPFEVSPCLDPAKHSLTQLRRILREPDRIQKAYREEGARNGFTNFKRFKEWYLKSLDDRAKHYLPQMQERLESIRGDFCAQFSRYFRLFCASRRFDSILMWSHYAKNHSGAVIAFDTSQSPLNQLGDYIVDVVYSDSKPEFGLKKRTSEFKKAFLEVASTKAKVWEYEEEVRLFFPVNACDNGHFVPISSKAVQHIYFGTNATQTYKRAILKELDAPDYSHVGVTELLLSPSQYGFEFKIIRSGEPTHSDRARPK